MNPVLKAKDPTWKGRDNASQTCNDCPPSNQLSLSTPASSASAVPIRDITVAVYCSTVCPGHRRVFFVLGWPATPTMEVVGVNAKMFSGEALIFIERWV
jgi:hypothetical protein